MHLALMQKTVADYMKALLDRKDLLRFVTMRSHAGLMRLLMLISLLTANSSTVFK